MKKLILLFTFVAISFSADKWEYLVCQIQKQIDPKLEVGFSVLGDETSKYNNVDIKVLWKKGIAKT